LDERVVDVEDFDSGARRERLGVLSESDLSRNLHRLDNVPSG
jgi:hypothetical protein